MRGDDEQVYVNKSDNSDEINKFPKRPQLSKLSQGEKDQNQYCGLLRGYNTHRIPFATLPVLVNCPRLMFNSPPFFCTYQLIRIPLPGRPVTCPSSCLIIFFHHYEIMYFYFILCVIIETTIIYFVVQALATGSSYVFLTSPHPHLLSFFSTSLLSSSTRCPVTAWESTTSPRSPGSLSWRTACGQRELGARGADYCRALPL